MHMARRIAKWLAIALGAVVVLLLVLLGGAAIALNTAAGQRMVAGLINREAKGSLAIAGLSGTIPTDLRLATVRLQDREGTWATASGLALRLRLLPLLHGKLIIDELSARRIALLRPPLASRKTPPQPASGPYQAEIPGLPVQIDLRSLTIGEVKVSRRFTGTVGARLAVAGSATVTGRNMGRIALALRDLDGAGRYGAAAALMGQALDARLTLDEPAHGLIARLARLPDLGALHLAAHLAGPQSAARLALDLAAGPLTAAAHGTIDIPGEAAQLAITAHAPAMQPAPGLGWQKVDIALTTAGPFTKPTAQGHILLQGLAAGGASLRSLTAEVGGDLGAVQLHARLVGLAAPGLPPGLLGDAPIEVSASAALQAPAEPVHVTIRHPLAALTLDGTLKPGLAARFTLDLPQLAPLAAIAHQSLQGSARITGTASRASGGAGAGGAMAAHIAAAIHLTQAMPQAMALTGGRLTLGADARMAGKTLTLSTLTLQGADIDLAAHGTLQTASEALALDWHLALARLGDLSPTLSGALSMTGHAAGTVRNLAVAAHVTGRLGARAGGKLGRAGPIDLQLAATGLPAAPEARITLTGAPAGAPAHIALTAGRSAQGAVSLRIAELSWKSLSGSGDLALAPGARLPTGALSLAITRLGDFAFLLGQPLGGSLSLTVQAPPGQAAHVALQAHGLAFGTNRLAGLALTGTVQDPMGGDPRIGATARLTGLSAAAVRGDARLTAQGPLSALALTLDANLPDLQGAPAHAAARATLDVQRSRLALAALTAAWHGESLRLLGPSRIAFGKAMAVDHLRLAAGPATIEASGSITPRLALTARLSNLTPALIQPFAPNLHLAGRFDAAAELSGSLAAPRGTVTLTGRGLRETTGPAASLPAASLDARAQLAGRTADLALRLDAGSASHLAITGTTPISPSGRLALAIGGKLDLALIDPIMQAQGRQIAGMVTLALQASGTLKQPVIGGQIALDRGRFQDYVQGLTLSAITARIEARGQDLILRQFDAQAGNGTIAMTGRIGALAPGVPIDLRITARDASPVQSDLLTAVFDSALHVAGSVASGITAAGTLHIRRAEINIPDSFPPSVAVLTVHKPGEKPAPPQPPAPPIHLDLTLSAPRAIFVRGHGLDAELGGQLHLGGTLADLQPHGHFDMIRGTFSLVTSTLTFTTGKVGFDGGKITDPSLDFEATTESGSITATLAVTGYASAPKISLTSSPVLPQDEVLAQLLFHSSTAQLSPFQLVTIASAVAQIAGVNTGGGPGGVLNSLRQGLGLDELSIGSSTTPSAIPSNTTTTNKTQSAPTLQAGRYVAPGIYVGAVQGTGLGGSGANAGTAAQVQIDIAKGLKLETQVGGNSNGVGVTYQFKY
ncbi:translocation/assembly module TamB domain-containing protein [Acidisoma sp. C75]